VPKIDRARIVLAFQLCVGLFGQEEIILFLTNKRKLIYCRLFTKLHTGFGYGLLSPGGLARNIVSGCNRLLMIVHDFFSRLLGGGILIGLQMFSSLMSIVFLWLIFISTLSDQ
jgi:hypothetical protein